MLKRLANAKIPIILTLIFIALDVLAGFQYIDEPINQISQFVEWAGQTSVLLLVLVAFLENLVVVNVYTPGSIVLLAAMAQTEGDIDRAGPIYLAITIGGLTAHLLNFSVGKLSRRPPPKATIVKRSDAVLFGHPHTAALTSLRLGASGMTLGRFLPWLLVVVLSWNLFWSLAAILAWPTAGSSSLFTIIVYGYLSVWITMRLISSGK